MGSFSDYTELKVLDHIVGKTTFALPTVWLGLSTADPGDDAAGLTEPGSNYARKSTAGADWNAAAAGAIDNANPLSFIQATGSWGTITHFGLFDAVSGGNMLAHGALTASKVIDNGDTGTFAAGDIDITLD